jgi:predicted nuclease of predicted toxin-antitoxin system
MKFLIDECLGTGLVQVAINAGHLAQHVAHIGLQGTKDWRLVPFLIQEDFVLVTRNSDDFRGKGGKPGYLTSNDLHPGLICLNAENMNGALMVELFRAALDYISRKNIVDLMNQVLEVKSTAPNSVTFQFYDAP